MAKTQKSIFENISNAILGNPYYKKIFNKNLKLDKDLQVQIAIKFFENSIRENKTSIRDKNALLKYVLAQEIYKYNSKIISDDTQKNPPQPQEQDTQNLTVHHNLLDKMDEYEKKVQTKRWMSLIEKLHLLECAILCSMIELVLGPVIHASFNHPEHFLQEMIEGYQERSKAGWIILASFIMTVICLTYIFHHLLEKHSNELKVMSDEIENDIQHQVFKIEPHNLIKLTDLHGKIFEISKNGDKEVKTKLESILGINEDRAQVQQKTKFQLGAIYNTLDKAK
jgi:hypothetical protein